MGLDDKKINMKWCQTLRTLLATHLISLFWNTNSLFLSFSLHWLTGCSLVIKPFSSTNSAQLYCWKSKCQAAEELQPWFETDPQRRRGVQQTQGNTLGRGKKPTYLTTNFQSPWSNKSPKCVCPHSISPFSSWWLNAIYMRSTATKALLPQIAHCDRHMFLIRPWEDNHCFSLILWKQRKMCKRSLTLHQSALPPGPENITVFIIATTQGTPPPKFSVVKSTTGGIFILCKKTNVFYDQILLNLNHFEYLTGSS